jgi:hypothetical protein
MVMEKVSGLLSGVLGGGQKAPAPAGYPSALNLVMGDTDYNTAAKVIALLPAAGARARIWEFTIPGGNWKYRWGFGSPLTQANQGYWWFAVAQAGVDIQVGIVTLGYESYDRHTQIIIEEKHDIMLNTGTNTSIAALKLQNKNEMQALPEGGSQGNSFFVQQFSRLYIDYYTITASGGADIADFQIPVTIYGG